MSGISLICGDGAIRGGFIAGAVTRLLEKYPQQMKNLTNITASSASVGSMFYYISHLEEHPGREVWMNSLSSEKFIRYNGFSDFFKDEPIYDIEYMSEYVFRRENPLNVEKILNSTVNYYFPVYNLDLKRIEIFTNRRLEEVPKAEGYPYKINTLHGQDIYHVIHAANAAPFVYDRSVRIGEYQYMDAAAWMPHLIDFPGVKGTKKILIVTKYDDSFRRRLTYMGMGFLLPLLFLPFRKKRLPLDAYFQYGRKPGVIHKNAHESNILLKYDSFVAIKPKVKLGAQTDNDPKTLKANFMQGYNLVDDMSLQFEEFFSA